MRERPYDGNILGQCVRITPARAGKTRRLTTVPYRPGDHPRSCGKDRCRSTTTPSTIGSPPLVRERLEFAGQCLIYVGITPARAGKTDFKKAERIMGKDHPRSCGKDQPDTPFKDCATGSPPLVRERLIAGKEQLRQCGITPARAGKTQQTQAVRIAA